MKGIRKIKVLGYPFAVAREAQGCALTPYWLSSQRWFRKLKDVEYETVKVTRIDHKSTSAEITRDIIIRNSLELRK